MQKLSTLPLLQNDAQEQKVRSRPSSRVLLACVLFVAHTALFNVSFCNESYDALVPVGAFLSLGARRKRHGMLPSWSFIKQVKRYVVWGSVVNQPNRRLQPHWTSGPPSYSTSIRKRKPYKASGIAPSNARGKSNVQL